MLGVVLLDASCSLNGPDLDLADARTIAIDATLNDASTFDALIVDAHSHSTDARTTDARTTDARVIDAAVDARALDAHALDARALDARTNPDAATVQAIDAARPDAARPDAARPDAARPDAARPDAARPDAALPDAAQPDAAQPDAAQPDAAGPDAALPDAALPDAARPDAAPADAGPPPPAASWTPDNSGTSPSPRDSGVMAYDALHQQTIMFGGVNNASGHFERLDETWMWNGSTWTQLSPVHSPGAGNGMQMAYDEAMQEIILFGGLPASGPLSLETWAWDGSDWTLLTTAHNPPGAVFGAMAYDAARQQLVLFGGQGDNGATTDTWLWDGVDWSLASPTHSPPAFSEGAPMAYDRDTKDVILFGGDVQNGAQFTNATWSWNGHDWTQLSPTTSPTVRSDSVMVYDDARHRIVLFGGFGGSSPQYLNDTWEGDGSDWRQAPENSSLPPCNESEMAYDSANQQVVLFAGFNGNSGPINETWLMQ